MVKAFVGSNYLSIAYAFKQSGLVVSQTLMFLMISRIQDFKIVSDLVGYFLLFASFTLVVEIWKILFSCNSFLKDRKTQKCTAEY